MLTGEEALRYSRHIKLLGFGTEGQQRLKTARVLVIGVGGLGSPAALYLAAAGVGTIALMDGDKVSLSNLQRQILHATPDLNRGKTLSASEKLQALNPHICIETIEEMLSPANAQQTIAAYDFIIDATDSLDAKYLINDTCVALGKPYSHAALLQSFYAPGYRWAFFPSYSVAWRVSEERFFKNIFPWMTNLKFRWSDGISGSNQGSAYQYLLGYSQSGANYMFADNAPVMGYNSTSVAETLLSWTRTYMRDFGFDWEINRGIIGGSIDWFWRDKTGKAATSSNSVPDMYGVNLPQLNLDADQNVGIDLELSHRMRFKDFNYRVTATATFARERDTYKESALTKIYKSSQQYYDENTIGRWDNALEGKYYEWNGKGQFADWNEIFDYPVLYNTSSSKKMNMGEMLPGMYKIDDYNGDGVITKQDRHYSWKEGNPPLQFGLMIFMEYKDFDLSATFNGAALSHKNMQMSGGMGYGWSKTLFVNHLDHYRLADGYDDPRDPNSVWVAGYWPALAPASGAEDSSSNATYRFVQPYSWVDNSFFRLKSLELGYNLPKPLLKKLHLKRVRVHASGTNLLTFCNPIVKVWDPETNQSSRRGASGAPLLKTYVIGTSISF